MYMEVGEPHHLPHFHAYYQDDVAVFTLDPIELIPAAPAASAGGGVGGVACRGIDRRVGTTPERPAAVGD
jgi:hypothetical protein